MRRLRELRGPRRKHWRRWLSSWSVLSSVVAFTLGFPFWFPSVNHTITFPAYDITFFRYPPFGLRPAEVRSGRTASQQNGSRREWGLWDSLGSGAYHFKTPSVGAPGPVGGSSSTTGRRANRGFD